MIDKITRLPVRQIWKDEARDFSTWLEENIEVLSDVMDFNIIDVAREQTMGNFYVDLLAQDSDGNRIVIENQLNKSDHDHLGKVITYLASFDATKAIWIVTDARTEHIQAINWLNEVKDVNFYLVKLEAIKIGDSKPAALFTLIVGPSEEMKKAGSTKKNLSELNEKRYAFWTEFLELSNQKGHQLFRGNSPTGYNWIGAGSGLAGVRYSYWLNKETMQLVIYIDRGKDQEELNLSIFNKILEKRVEIEQSFGDQLNWRELEQYRACTIVYEMDRGGWGTPREEWQFIHELAVEKMILLEKATKKIINAINL